VLCGSFRRSGAVRSGTELARDVCASITRRRQWAISPTIGCVICHRCPNPYDADV
jgi:hypothetical protein